MTRKMKDSGVEWIGDIPEEWEVVPNKRIMKKVKNICEIYKDEKVLSLTMNGVIVRDLENPSGKMPLTFDGYQYVEKNNLLMCLFDIDVTPRCIGIIENNGITSPAYSQFELTNDADVKYYYYYYLNLDYTKELLHLAKNLRHSLTEGQLGEVYVPMPSKEEQTQIASYLDKKCNKIDQTIEKEQVVIEKLKEYKQSVITEAVTKGLNPDVPMKDSGVEWIGEIPEEWEIIDVKKIFNIVNGSTPKSDEDEYWNGDIVWITPAEMGSDTITICNSKRKITKAGMSSCGTTLVPQGSIIISNRAPIGLICIAGTELCTNQGCKSLVKMNNNINNKYYYYFMMTQVSTLNMLGRGTTFLELSTTDLSNFKVIAPNSNQNQIVDYLDKKCSAIDKLISSKEKLIDKLTEYKKSLIYECVTGKREVQ